MTLGKKILVYGSFFIIGMYFLFLSFVEAKSFLAPLLTAIVLSLLMVPVSKKLESWKIGRAYTSLISTILLLLVSLGFVLLVSLQVKSFISDWDKVKEKIIPEIEKLEALIYEKTPINKDDVKLKDAASSSAMGKQALSFVNSFYSFAGNYLLTFIYIFFLLNFRSHFRKFFIKLFSDEKKQEVSNVISQTANVVQAYLLGKFILMSLLAVLYCIGLGISGVNNFIVVSLLAALLTIVPYLGNVIGFLLALSLGYLTTGEISTLIGIIITFSAAQFVESYILEPYIVGDKVNLNPFITILAVVAGGILWGIIGMVLAVPVIAIANMIFNHVEPLKPYSYLLSKEEKKDDK